MICSKNVLCLKVVIMFDLTHEIVVAGVVESFRCISKCSVCDVLVALHTYFAPISKTDLNARGKTGLIHCFVNQSHLYLL